MHPLFRKSGLHLSLAGGITVPKYRQGPTVSSRAVDLAPDCSETTGNFDGPLELRADESRMEPSLYICVVVHDSPERFEVRLKHGAFRFASQLPQSLQARVVLSILPDIRNDLLVDLTRAVRRPDVDKGKTVFQLPPCPVSNVHRRDTSMRKTLHLDVVDPPECAAELVLDTALEP